MGFRTFMLNYMIAVKLLLMCNVSYNSNFKTLHINELPVEHEFCQLNSTIFFGNALQLV